MIPTANAIVDPNTMMIESIHTKIANSTVLGSSMPTMSNEYFINLQVRQWSGSYNT